MSTTVTRTHGVDLVKSVSQTQVEFNQLNPFIKMPPLPVSLNSGVFSGNMLFLDQTIQVTYPTTAGGTGRVQRVGSDDMEDPEDLEIFILDGQPIDA